MAFGSTNSLLGAQKKGKQLTEKNVKSLSKMEQVIGFGIWCLQIHSICFGRKVERSQKSTGNEPFNCPNMMVSQCIAMQWKPLFLTANRSHCFLFFSQWGPMFVSSKMSHCFSANKSSRLEGAHLWLSIMSFLRNNP